MREFIVLIVHSIVTLVRLAKPGGLRSVVAESVLVRHQLLILNRGRKRAPNLHPAESDHRWLVHPLHASGPRLTVRDRFEAFHSAVFPPSAEETEVPHVVLTSAASSAWTQGIGQRAHQRRCRDETA